MIMGFFKKKKKKAKMLKRIKNKLFFVAIWENLRDSELFKSHQDQSLQGSCTIYIQTKLHSNYNKACLKIVIFHDFLVNL